mgnify:CR=1 FL=1
MAVWRRRGIGIGLVCALLLALAPAARAQDDVERARFNVQQWLLRTLGKPGLILVEYTYSGASWPDTSMGCPAAGETYRPEMVHGYRWTFLYDNLVRYEVHSNLDGTMAVLCSSTNVAPDVRLTTYSTPAFTILAPEPWLVFANSDKSEVLFAPQADDDCDQPGMRVTVLGRVASGVTPDQVIDDYLAGGGYTDTPTARANAGSLGRTTEFESACDALTRRWRVSAFVQYGSAYRVEQWAPQDQFEQWAELFTNMVNQFSPADASMTLPGEPTDELAGDSGAGQAVEPAGAIELAGLPMAHVFVGDIFIGTLNAIPGRSVTTVPTWERRFLAFSPDGLLLAFVDVTNAELRVIDTAAGRSPRRVAAGIDPAFPPAWSPDGSQIAYVAPGEGDAAPFEIRAVPAGGGEPQTLGTFTLDGECPIAPDDPADRAYFVEAGPGGHDPVLVWLPGDLFLVSLRCDGGLGVLSLADGQITALGADLIDGALAPDRTRFAARTESGIAILDFQTWQRTNLGLGEGVRQIAWSADGETVYVSLERLADSLTLDGAADQARGEEVFGFWPATIRVYDITLAAVDLETRQERTLWRGQGRGIGRIAPAPDGSGVLFTLVPSGTLVAEAFQNGADAFALRENWPVAGLYWLGTGDTTARLLAYSGQPAFAPVTVGGE